MCSPRCVVPADNQLGETPLWCPRTQSVWWLDIENPKLQRYHPATGACTTYPIATNYLGSLALRAGGGFLIALDTALYTFDVLHGSLEHFCDVEPADNGNRLNDGRCDAQGRFWVGTMDNGLSAPAGSLYCIHPDRSVVRHQSNVIVSNSLAIAPDQRTLYFSDTRRFTTWVFDLDPMRGVLSRRRVFADFSASRERPDGACIDAQGYLWLAMFGGSRVVRYTPCGVVDRMLPLPVKNPTCVCFGGPDLATLYITTARKFLSDDELEAGPWSGGLLAVEPGVRGLPESAFAG
jgi:sugar lactone lactonase YvrE